MTNLKLKLTSSKVEIQSLKSGDHIYAHHGVNLNSHHGIYVGGEQVIHFTSTKSKHHKGNPCQKCGYQKNDHQGVVKTCLDCFLSEGSHFVNHSLRLYQYNIPTKNAGSCSTSASKPNDEVINTATGFLNYFDYSLFDNDNESFAIYCKTGTLNAARDDHSKTSKKKKSKKKTTHEKKNSEMKPVKLGKQKEEKEEEGEEEEEEEEEESEEEEEEEEEEEAEAEEDEEGGGHGIKGLVLAAIEVLSAIGGEE